MATQSIVALDGQLAISALRRLVILKGGLERHEQRHDRVALDRAGPERADDLGTELR
jgi:hypothetical protein